MPCDIGTIPWLEREHHHAYQTIREVLEGSARRLNGTTGKALLREAVENNEMFRLESVAAELAEKPVLCVAGSLDAYTPPDFHCAPLARAIRTVGGTQFQSVVYPTDHFFADYRLTVSNVVTEFLTGLMSR